MPRKSNGECGDNNFESECDKIAETPLSRTRESMSAAPGKSQRVRSEGEVEFEAAGLRTKI